MLTTAAAFAARTVGRRRLQHTSASAMASTATSTEMHQHSTATAVHSTILEPRIVRRSVSAADLAPFYPQQRRPALAAMRARLRLPQTAVTLEELAQCALATDTAHFEPAVSRGRDIAQRAVQMHLRARYPNMPAWLSDACRRSVLGADTGPPTSERLVTVARRIGFQHVADVDSQTRLGEMPLAFLSLLDGKFTSDAAETLVKTLIMPYRIDWEQLVGKEVAGCGDDDFTQSRFAPLIKEFYGTTADRRLLSESGRLSERPAFVVGIFAGTHKLGEGSGYSLATAGREAEVDALLKIVLRREPLVPIDVATVPFNVD